jgi:hypothetical protein
VSLSDESYWASVTFQCTLNKERIVSNYNIIKETTEKSDITVSFYNIRLKMEATDKSDITVSSVSFTQFYEWFDN